MLMRVSVLLLVGFSASAQTTLDLNAVVASKSGHPIADLTQNDFTLLDNNVPQSIASFRALGPQGFVHVILVIDAVNAPLTSIAYQRGELKKYLSAKGGQLANPTQLAFFTDSGFDFSDSFSTDGNELNTILSQHDISLRNIRRSSQDELDARLRLSINALRSLLVHEASLPGRKIVLWISPGWPFWSDLRRREEHEQEIYSTVVELSTRMRQEQLVLYCVDPVRADDVGRAFYYRDFLKPVTKPNQAQWGNLSLQVLAVQSGGLTLGGLNDVASMLRQCVADAKASYQLSFTPSDNKGGYHNLELRVNRPGLTARTRQGYYQ
jgi:VWFA-related protein